MLTLREQDLSKGIVMKFSSFHLLFAASSFAAACVTGCYSNDEIKIPENIGASVQPELSVYIGDSGFPSSPHCFEYDNHTVCGDDVVLGVGPVGGSASPSAWGLCTFIKSEFSFANNYSVLKIDVGADGYYHLIAAVADSTVSRVLAFVTCRKMNEFIGLPSPSLANTTKRFSVNSLAPVPVGNFTSWPSISLTNAGAADDALCVWHGFAGSISNDQTIMDQTPDTISGLRYDPVEGYLLEARAQHQNLTGPLVDNRSLTSFASCDSWAAAHQWKYQLEKATWVDGAAAYYSFTGLHPQTYQGADPLYVDIIDGDCFLQGLTQHGPKGLAATFGEPLPNLAAWLVGGQDGVTWANPQCIFIDQQ